MYSKIKIYIFFSILSFINLQLLFNQNKIYLVLYLNLAILILAAINEKIKEKKYYKKNKLTIENGVIRKYKYISVPNSNTSDLELVIHSENDEPAIEYPNGTKEWYFYGQLHRIKNPAVIHSNGDQEWWYMGLRHKADGPAVITKDREYWFEFGEFVKCIQK